MTLRTVVFAIAFACALVGAGLAPARDAQNDSPVTVEQLIAQALAENVPIISSDTAFAAYGATLIW